MVAYEAVIGLEVHVQLATASKLFCSCPTTFGQPANANVCEVCSGMPGALPVPNRQAVHFATLVGLATNCAINTRSIFARKNYFYPDLPAGYQISPPPPLPAKPVILDPAGNSTGIEVTLPNAGESVIVRSYSGELAHVMDGVDAGLQSVLTAQASVGSRRLEADNAGKLGEDLSLVYAKTRSNLEDLDIPKAASDLAMAQMALQASQLSFSKVQGMSLFNYI